MGGALGMTRRLGFANRETLYKQIHTNTRTHSACTKRDPLQLGHLVDMQPLFLSQVGALDHDTALLRALSEGEIQLVRNRKLSFFSHNGLKRIIEF